jgi:PBSX family phage portal protein
MADEKFDEHGFGQDPRIGSVRASVIKLAGGDDGTNPLIGDVSRAIQNVEEDEQFFQEKGALEPPYDPRILNLLFEHSNALRQNVDAYATNIDGFGHAFSAVVDLESDSTLDDVRALIVMERLGEDGVIDPNAPEPSDEETSQRIKQLANEQRAETLKLAAFFDDCSDISFADLRRQTRQDIEITGNGYWEVVRDRVGKIARFHLLESFTMRLTKLDRELTDFKVKRRTLTQEFEEVTRRRRFRRFLQRVGRDAVYFKEFGDPRVISTRTGKAYADKAALEKEEPEASEASEVMHFRVPSSRSAYGIPRWIGNLLSVLGSRQSEEVNFNYFENKSVPPLAVLVSGGRLTKDSVTKLENFIKDNIRGKANFHKILVIEAEGDNSSAFENSGRMKVELKPLTEAQAQEGLFQGYDERNIDKVGMSFRLPRMLRGDTRDFNRSTAMAALDFAERQVFEPERQSFDYRMNRDILPQLNIKRWRMKSNGPTQRDPESLAKMIHDLQDFMTPNTMLELSQQVFNRNFARINAPWGDQPLKLTLATMNAKPVSETPEAEDTDPDNQAPNNEPDAPGQNEDGQGRTPDGRFGADGKPNGKAPPKKTRVQPARKHEYTLTDDDLDEVADAILGARDRLTDVVTKRLAARSMAKRVEDPAGDVP